VPAELPAVKWTLDAIVHNSSTYAQMGSQMRAISVQHTYFSFFGPKNGQILVYIKIYSNVTLEDYQL
jgi:hypothetical protein